MQAISSDSKEAIAMDHFPYDDSNCLPRSYILALFREAYRILKPGHSFFLTCLDYEVDDARKDLEESGFEIKSVRLWRPREKLHMDRWGINDMRWFCDGKYGGPTLVRAIKTSQV